MRTLDLLNIMTQPFIKVKVFIEDTENLLCENYGYPLYKKLKCCTDYACLDNRELNYLYYSEIKCIRFDKNKLMIVLEKFKGEKIK